MAAIDQLSGTTLGPYELRSLLGQGGMGAVYRAFHPALNREVAIKLLKAQSSPAPGYLERFVREAQTAATLEHPHIVAVHDFGQQTLEDDSQVYYIVMRMLTGGTLSDRLLDGQRLSAGETVRILTQLAGALDYAHQRGVIHRDIKPGNVMFDALGSAYIVDFGIARMAHMETLTETGTAMGTPAFMAPEQWRGEIVTPAADQYALGVLVYRMLTGVMPFAGDTPYTLMYQHLNEQPTPPDGIRSDLVVTVGEVLRRAMAKQPEDRYPTISDFAHALRAAVEAQDDLPTTAARTRSVSPTTNQMKNEPTQTLSTAASLTSLPQRSIPWWTLPVVALPLLAVVLVMLIATRPPAGSPSGTAATATMTATILPLAAAAIESPSAIATVVATDAAATEENPGIAPTATFLISVNPVEAATAAEITSRIAESPNNPDLYFERGSAFIDYSDCIDAIPDFTRVLELDPAYEYAYLSRAYCYSELNQPRSGAADALQYLGLRQAKSVNADPLLPDQPVTLTITPDVIYRLPITLTAGALITITADAAAESLDPMLILLTPDDTPVIHNDDVSLSLNNFNSAIRNFRVPASGDYTVLVTHAAGGNNGDVTVQLKVTPP